MVKKYIIPALLLCLIVYYGFNFFYNKYKISKLHFGVKANPLRTKLYVPIIDDYMKANKFYSGSRWESKADLPKDDKVLNVWKIIIPLSDTAGLFEESDAFRKKFNDSLFYQLNIISNISGDTIANRKGSLFFYNKNSLFNMDLNEYKIDSIANSWGLTYLVRRFE